MIANSLFLIWETRQPGDADFTSPLIWEIWHLDADFSRMQTKRNHIRTGSDICDRYHPREKNQTWTLWKARITWLTIREDTQGVWFATRDDKKAKTMQWSLAVREKEKTKASNGKQQSIWQERAHAVRSGCNKNLKGNRNKKFSLNGQDQEFRWWGVALRGCGVAHRGCSVAHRGCGVASRGCGVAEWLARWTVDVQSQVWFSPSDCWFPVLGSILTQLPPPPCSPGGRVTIQRGRAQPWMTTGMNTVL